jgi:hypothetical protein
VSPTRLLYLPGPVNEEIIYTTDLNATIFAIYTQRFSIQPSRPHIEMLFHKADPAFHLQVDFEELKAVLSSSNHHLIRIVRHNTSPSGHWKAQSRRNHLFFLRQGTGETIFQVFWCCGSTNALSMMQWCMEPRGWRSGSSCGWLVRITLHLREGCALRDPFTGNIVQSASFVSHVRDLRTRRAA